MRSIGSPAYFRSWLTKVGNDNLLMINAHVAHDCTPVSYTHLDVYKRQGVYSSGIPLQPNKAWRKTAALVMNIDEMSKRLKAIERKVNQQD